MRSWGDCAAPMTAPTSNPAPTRKAINIREWIMLLSIPLSFALTSVPSLYPLPLHDLAVAHLDRAAGILHNPCVMRGKNAGHPRSTVQLEQEFNNLLRGVAVQVGCGLIGQDERRAGH